MQRGKIVVVGSTNMDMVVKTDHIPAPGETILSDSFFMNPGGKGANQAVAVARLGGEVSFITRLGNDIFGNRFAGLFAYEGMDTRFISYDPQLPTGVALIAVDKNGENSIVVASGANAAMEAEEVKTALDQLPETRTVLMQLESPMNVVEFVAAYAAERNIQFILNPAPAQSLSAQLLKRVHILTPNKTEATIISGIDVHDRDTAAKAAMAIHEKGVKQVIVTLGALGAVICDQGKLSVVEGKPVQAVDTTGAGDVFNGALAVALNEGRSLADAVAFACQAAAISVTRYGAQAAVPARSEIKEDD